MTFISYAQNFEDVLLWRALKHIKNGFYIDVGANDPVIDSVTKAFYDRGWSGINIEPLPQHFNDICTDRKRDINLQVAAGKDVGEIDIWESDVRGWATASSIIRDGLVSAGKPVRPLMVAQTTLEKVCEEYAQGEIHFLKIDVEGFEADVLCGANFTLYRPWVVVVESTQPNSQIENFEIWEQTLLSQNYTFIYADGLNRFYLACEHAELAHHFRFPPNVFDDFVLYSAIHRADSAEKKVQELESRLTGIESELRQIMQSTSWKITAPMRKLKSWLK